MKKEGGFSLIEVLVSLAILCIIAAGSLSGIATASKAVFIADERATAKNLAESQVEYVKKHDYAASYAPVLIPGEYDGYVAAIDTETLRYGNIQKITVTVQHHDKGVTMLEAYKVNR